MRSSSSRLRTYGFAALVALVLALTGAGTGPSAALDAATGHEGGAPALSAHLSGSAAPAAHLSVAAGAALVKRADPSGPWAPGALAAGLVLAAAASARRRRSSPRPCGTTPAGPAPRAPPAAVALAP
ncbi:MAG: hypothetical protein ACJ74O_20190 [Frankiaceae bacterium]